MGAETYSVHPKSPSNSSLVPSASHKTKGVSESSELINIYPFWTSYLQGYYTDNQVIPMPEEINALANQSITRVRIFWETTLLSVLRFEIQRFEDEF